MDTGNNKNPDNGELPSDSKAPDNEEPSPSDINEQRSPETQQDSNIVDSSNNKDSDNGESPSSNKATNSEEPSTSSTDQQRSPETHLTVTPGSRTAVKKRAGKGKPSYNSAKKCKPSNENAHYDDIFKSASVPSPKFPDQKKVQKSDQNSSKKKEVTAEERNHLLLFQSDAKVTLQSKDKIKIPETREKAFSLLRQKREPGQTELLKLENQKAFYYLQRKQSTRPWGKKAHFLFNFGHVTEIPEDKIPDLPWTFETVSLVNIVPGVLEYACERPTKYCLAPGGDGGFGMGSVKMCSCFTQIRNLMKEVSPDVFLGEDMSWVEICERKGGTEKEKKQTTAYRQGANLHVGPRIDKTKIPKEYYLAVEVLARLAVGIRNLGAPNAVYEFEDLVRYLHEKCLVRPASYAQDKDDLRLIIPILTEKDSLAIKFLDVCVGCLAELVCCRLRKKADPAVVCQWRRFYAAIICTRTVGIRTLKGFNYTNAWTVTQRKKVLCQGKDTADEDHRKAVMINHACKYGARQCSNDEVYTVCYLVASVRYQMSGQDEAPTIQQVWDVFTKLYSHLIYNQDTMVKFYIKVKNACSVTCPRPDDERPFIIADKTLRYAHPKDVDTFFYPKDYVKIQIVRHTHHQDRRPPSKKTPPSDNVQVIDQDDRIIVKSGKRLTVEHWKKAYDLQLTETRDMLQTKEPANGEEDLEARDTLIPDKYSTVEILRKLHAGESLVVGKPAESTANFVVEKRVKNLLFKTKHRRVWEGQKDWAHNADVGVFATNATFPLETIGRSIRIKAGLSAKSAVRGGFKRENGSDNLFYATPRTPAALFQAYAPEAIDEVDAFTDTIQKASAMVLNMDAAELEKNYQLDVVLIPSLMLNDFTKRTKSGMHTEYPHAELQKYEHSEVLAVCGELPLRACGMEMEVYPKTLFTCEAISKECDDIKEKDKCKSTFSGTVMHIHVGSFVLRPLSLHTATGIMATMGTCPYLRVQAFFYPKNSAVTPATSAVTTEEWLSPDCYYDEFGQISLRMTDDEKEAWKQYICAAATCPQSTTLKLRKDIWVPSVVGITPLGRKVKERVFGTSEHVRLRLGKPFWFRNMESVDVSKPDSDPATEGANRSKHPHYEFTYVDEDGYASDETNVAEEQLATSDQMNVGEEQIATSDETNGADEQIVTSPKQLFGDDSDL